MNVSPYETELKSQTEKETNSNSMAPDYSHFASEQAHLIQEVQNLKSRNAWLTGAVIALFLGLGGGGTWFLTSQKSQDKANIEDLAQIQNPVETQIQKLQQDLDVLQQQIPDDLIESLSINQEGIQRLETQLEQLIGKLDRLQIDLPNIELPIDSSELDELPDDESLDPESENQAPQSSLNESSSPATSN